ncbi:MAG: two-component system nitrogen regulation sensor histidine kinase GlnL, partial [Cocleimonas sp.]
MLEKPNKILSYGLIEDTLSTSIIVLDKSLTILQMNAAAENLFGQSRERVINKPFSSILNQELKQEDLQFAIDFVAKNNKPHIIRGCDLHNKQERITTIDCIANPIFTQNEYIGIVLELYRTDHQLKVAREDQLLSEQEAIQKLVRGMAHEIKNPLGGVRGAAQLLESELDDEALKEYTTIIIAEADRLQNLVDRMLGARKPNKNQLTNIHEVLERVRHLVKADIPKNVNLTFDYDPSIPTFNADLDNLIQIVLNIVVNA